MEYFGNCSKCGHHLIIESRKTISRTTKKLPSRLMKCNICGATSRITIVGTVEKPVSSTNEYDPTCGTTNTLRVQLWK